MPQRTILVEPSFYAGKDAESFLSLGLLLRQILKISRKGAY